jgi:hypothetical protein
MKRLIVGLFAFPALLAVAASVALMEQTVVVLCCLVASAVLVVIACSLLGFARFTGRRPWLVLAGTIACLALIVSVAAVHWPLRVAHALSRPALDQVARDLRGGQPFAGPARVGLFTIAEAEVNQAGIVCLWVDTNPGGKTGFVQGGPDHVPSNLWSVINLDDRWQFIHED